MNHSVIAAAECHYEALHKVTDVVARERKYLSITASPSFEQSVAFFGNLADKDFPHFVALVEGSVVGWCDISPVFGEARSHIGTLGIGLLPGYRGAGIGGSLMKASLDKAWAKGLTRIELTVRADNLNAIALYERLGFLHEGVRRNGFLLSGVYHDILAMALLRGGLAEGG